MRHMIFLAIFCFSLPNYASIGSGIHHYEEPTQIAEFVNTLISPDFRSLSRDKVNYECRKALRNSLLGYSLAGFQANEIKTQDTYEERKSRFGNMYKAKTFVIDITLEHAGGEEKVLSTTCDRRR